MCARIYLYKQLCYRYIHLLNWTLVKFCLYMIFCVRFTSQITTVYTVHICWDETYTIHICYPNINFSSNMVTSKAKRRTLGLQQKWAGAGEIQFKISDASWMWTAPKAKKVIKIWKAHLKPLSLWSGRSQNRGTQANFGPKDDQTQSTFTLWKFVNIRLLFFHLPSSFFFNDKTTKKNILYKRVIKILVLWNIID